MKEIERKIDNTPTPNLQRLSKSSFLEAVTLCFDTAYFRDGNNYYGQLTGVPAGNQLSGFLTEFVLDEVDALVVTKYKHAVVTWKLFVDDVFAIFGGEKWVVPPLQGLINSCDMSVQISSEKQDQDYTLTFLDIALKIVRGAGAQG